MNAKDKLIELSTSISKEVVHYIKNEINASEEVSSKLKSFIPRLAKVSEGGKRLRGGFVLMSYKMFGGKNKDIIKVAAAVEIMQTSMLVFDDVMDKADTRRGVPTIHKLYEEDFEKTLPQEALHIGNSMAICHGIMTESLSPKIILETSFSDKQKVAVLHHLLNTITLVSYGQAFDLLTEVLDDISAEDTLQVHRYKTATYTYENPLHVGAILAGASEEELKLLTDYAMPAGIAFQIQDDILGMFGDERKVGKPTISDLKEGKKTLLILKALEKASKKEKEIINNALGNENVTDEQHNAVKEIIESTGSLRYSKDLAEKYVKKALEVVEELEKQNLNQEGLDFLKGIAEYMINREL